MKEIFVSDIDGMAAGKDVVVRGWAQEIRMMKNIGFIIIRDSTGLVQATVKRDCPDFQLLEKISRESVVSVSGIIPESIKSNVGREIITSQITVLNLSETPLLIGITDNVETDMDTRFNSRFIDLRCYDLSPNIALDGFRYDSRNGDDALS